MRLAVVGHVEWVEFARVDRVPAAGEIAHALDDWSLPAGGGGVAAVQLAKLAGGCSFFTALGDDELGRRARDGFEELGVRMHVAWRAGRPTRRAVTFVDARGERTITTIGERLGPRGDDALPWQELGAADGVYFTAGDAAALRAARRARVLVATARERTLLASAGVGVDATVASAHDVAERVEPGEIVPVPVLSVATDGAAGGTWTSADGARGRYPPAPPVPPQDPHPDAYGAGDSFAGGLTYGLAAGFDVPGALALAARCGAACAAGRGPYASQLRAVDER